MSIRFKILVSFLCVSTMIIGQNPIKEKRFEINDFNLQLGYFGGDLVSLTPDDFIKLAPKSYLANEDLSSFKQNLGVLVGPYNRVYSGSIGVIKSSTKTRKIVPQMRFGLNYSNRTLFSSGLSWSQSIPYDTATLKNGESIYVDSASSKNHHMYYTSENLALDVSMIFRYNAAGRWSFFAGFGITSGISINAKSRFIYFGSERFVTKYPFNVYGTSTWIDNKEARREDEEFNAKTNLSTSFSCPLGVDFRITKKTGFWHNFHVFYEMKPSIFFTKIPELKTFSYTNSQNSIGLRLTLD